MRLDDAGPRTWLMATVAGWALLVWVLALLGMGAPCPAAGRPIPACCARCRRLPHRARNGSGRCRSTPTIAQRPLFARDRQPQPFFLQGQGDGEGQQTAFDFVLTSVLITPPLQMAILQPADGGEAVRVKLGDVPDSRPAGVVDIAGCAQCGDRRARKAAAT